MPKYQDNYKGQGWVQSKLEGGAVGTALAENFKELVYNKELYTTISDPFFE